MARKIFYARRSKRPMMIVFGLMGLTISTFYVGFVAGRAHPNMFALGDVVPVVVAER